MRCWKCGNEIEDNSLTCKFCGVETDSLEGQFVKSPVPAANNQLPSSNTEGFVQQAPINQQMNNVQQAVPPQVPMNQQMNNAQQAVSQQVPMNQQMNNVQQAVPQG